MSVEQSFAVVRLPITKAFCTAESLPGTRARVTVSEHLLTTEKTSSALISVSLLLNRLLRLTSTCLF